MALECFSKTKKIISNTIDKFKKKETTEMKMDETKRISAEQLEKLRNFNAFMEKARVALGDLSMQYEFQKADILSQTAIQQQAMAELEKEIKDEFGDVRINIETGEIVMAETQR